MRLIFLSSGSNTGRARERTGVFWYCIAVICCFLHMVCIINMFLASFVLVNKAISQMISLTPFLVWNLVLVSTFQYVGYYLFNVRAAIS